MLGLLRCSIFAWPARAWLALPAIMLGSTSGRADIPPGLQASMACKVDGSAVVCLVSAKPTPQSRITYSRADLVQAPPFLKTLIGSVDFSDSRDKRPRLNLAFRAERPGTGNVIVKVQAMVCAEDGSSCPNVQRVVVASVTVAR
jgi:hypothetical protein